MGKEYEQADVIEVPAEPEQVWAAIATGPGIDSWFMGRNEVEGGGVGGVVRGAFAGYQPTHGITAWDPPRRLAYGGEPEPDGRRIAYEFLVEGRAGGSSVIRCVTSGFLPGDDWADEFEAMTAGGALFLRNLAEYLRWFRGRTATAVTAFGSAVVADWPALWAALAKRLGVENLAVGAEVELAGAAGVVYARNEQTVGIRTGEGLYCFLQGFHGPLVATHHVMTADVDAAAEEAKWTEWIAELS
ncbi:SRPBCC family protein [Amycolatopsis benzoatilytica]|uniref:SRPBCC family protein n=1 Tax=Amycolatopsis benzoatilytica TaxID=346045 RepID=UPI000372A4D4|nr:SRPBCC domain-containing protein [Amycolatopsis benzoatilytica]